MGRAASSTNYKTTALTDDTINRIFTSLRSAYGVLFERNVGTDKQMRASKVVWADYLGDLTNDEIRYALNNLPEKYPPTPMEFKRIAKTKIPPYHKPIKIQKQIEMSPEIKEQRKQAAHKWRQKIKEEFGV